MTGYPLPSNSKELLRKYAHTLDRLQFVSKAPGSIAAAGRRPGTATGFSVDFADYRKYHYGDDIRYIDWNIYARLRKLFLRQFRAESELAIHLLLDVSNSMSFGAAPKLDLGRKLAAAFSYVGLSKQDRVGLATFSNQLHDVLPPQRSRHQLFHILKLLDEALPAGVSDFDQAFKSYVARASCRGLAVLISDCFSADGYQNAFRCLSFAGFEVVVVRVSADEELNPEMEEGVELRDLEHVEMRGPVVSGRVIEQYRRRMEEYSQEISAFCLSEGFPYVEVTTSIPFEQLTTRLLRAGILCGPSRS